MPREIHSHKVNPANDQIQIQVLDDPGADGASHVYEIKVPASEVSAEGPSGQTIRLKFQNGPILDAGINGITQEVLLAIVVDRLQSFQKGPYVCRENALALTKIEEAQHWLHHRTKARMERGVEGTHTV